MRHHHIISLRYLASLGGSGGAQRYLAPPSPIALHEEPSTLSPPQSKGTQDGPLVEPEKTPDPFSSTGYQLFLW